MFVDETKRAQFPSVPPSVTRIAAPKTRWEEQEDFSLCDAPAGAMTYSAFCLLTLAAVNSTRSDE